MNLTPEEKRSQGKALSLREFAQAGGISYSMAIALSKEPWFPIFHGKIWWEAPAGNPALAASPYARRSSTRCRS
jgi:hypothetical protein